MSTRYLVAVHPLQAPSGADNRTDGHKGMIKEREGDRLETGSGEEANARS